MYSLACVAMNVLLLFPGFAETASRGRGRPKVLSKKVRPCAPAFEADRARRVESAVPVEIGCRQCALRDRQVRKKLRRVANRMPQVALEREAEKVEMGVHASDIDRKGTAQRTLISVVYIL